MNPSPSEQPKPGARPRAEPQDTLFLEMVAQYTDVALMFLGRVPHPETGKSTRDLDSARAFIERLEMLEAKTKGNLNPAEESLLKQSLMAARLAFVEAVEESVPAGSTATGKRDAPPPTAAGEPDSPASSTTPAAGEPPSSQGDPSAAAEADARK